MCSAERLVSKTSSRSKASEENEGSLLETIKMAAKHVCDPCYYC